MRWPKFGWPEVRQKARIREDIRRQLMFLGGTADEVARSLHGLGVSGVPGDPFRCPISRWLRATVKLDPQQTLTSGWTLVTVSDDRWNAGGDAFVMTPAASGFIQAFDKGAYKDMVEVA